MKPKIKLIVARELGFCFGVRKSIDTALSVRAESDGNVTVLNELVHNRAVLKNLSSLGIRMVSEVQDAPPGKLIISAHGVPPGTVEEAKNRNLEIVDTTCPLVNKVHKLVAELTKDDYHIIVFGDARHDEVRGIVGYGDGRKMTVVGSVSDLPEEIPDRCALISQTTQSLDGFDELSAAARRRSPNVRIHNTICKPTRKRQQAAVEIARECELAYVIGSKTSANSRRLIEITERICGRSILIDAPDEIAVEQLEGARVVGLTAGASSPELLIIDTIDRLCKLLDVELVAEQPQFAGIAGEKGRQR